MKEHLKAPLSNLVAIVLSVVLGLGAAASVVRAPAVVAPQLVPLGVPGGTSNITGDLAVSGNASAASLTVGGVAQPGPLNYGQASNVISGTLIAHGIGTTPTVFIVEPGAWVTNNFTQPVYSLGCNVTSCTVAISPGATVTVTTLNWIAGK